MTIGKKVKKIMQSGFLRAKSRVALSTGEILRILREKNELTQSQLAKQTGLTQATISSLEKDRIRLGIERAKALARALHVHPAVLVFPDWDSSDEAA